MSPSEMSGLAATRNALVGHRIDWSLFEVVCLAHALAAPIMSMDKIAIDKKREKLFCTVRIVRLSLCDVDSYRAFVLKWALRCAHLGHLPLTWPRLEAEGWGFYYREFI
jgi:hypothetical protein